MAEAEAKEKKAEEEEARTRTTIDTGRVDREIEELKEQVEDLEQRLNYGGSLVDAPQTVRRYRGFPFPGNRGVRNHNITFPEVCTGLCSAKVPHKKRHRGKNPWSGNSPLPRSNCI